MRQSCFAYAALFVTAGAGLLVASCGPSSPPRAPWRDEAERACLRSGAVTPSAKIIPAQALQGGGPCGINYPFKVSELPQSRVALSKSTTMTCQIIPQLDNWVTNVVQPAAMQQFGTYVTEVEAMGSYSCRRINGSGTFSEHAYGNAVDIRSFKLADGRRIKVGEGMVPSGGFQMSAEYPAVKSRSNAPVREPVAEEEEWEQLVRESLDEVEDPVSKTSGAYQTASTNFIPPPIAKDQGLAFLDAIRQGGCENFSTVLGPGQRDHHDHLHFDLARRVSGKKVCK